MVHDRCSGHADIYDNGDYKTGKKIGERPCRHWPMHGQRICQTHGGKGRNKVVGAQQWAKERKIAAEVERAERAVKTFGLPLTINPQQALLDEIYRTAGHIQWLGELVGSLSTDDVVWGRVSEEHTEGTGEMATPDSADIDLTKTVMGARPAVWYQLYAAERSHMVHVCKVAIQCGIAERQVKIAEEQGQLIAQAWRGVIEAPELQLTEIQITQARVLVSKALRTMSMPRPGLPAHENGRG